MYKEVISQASTKQLRKAKLLDSFRQPTATRNNANRIMLTDLCPQEKAKIGDLVRTLETRKAQNKMLEEKLKQFQKMQKNYLDKISQFEKIVEQFTIKQLKFKQQIMLSKIKQQERQKYIEHLISEKQEQQKKIEKRKQNPCIDQFALTDPVLSLNQSVQVNQKKKKCKQKQIQTQQIGLFRESGRRYPNNSKSFEKIMRGRTQSYSISNEKNRGRKNDQMKKSFGGKKSEIKIDDGEEQLSNYEQNDENEKEQQNEESAHQQNEDDDFNELAKKWLQMKQKNMQKIKQSYEKSKQRQNSSHDKGKRREVRSHQVPRQFNQRNQRNMSEQEGDEGNMHLQDNESFGPKRSQLKQFSEKSKWKQIQREEDQDLDDIQLNKILKSKNFSASRLLKKSMRQESQQSEVQRREGKQQRNSKKGMRLQSLQGAHNTPNMKTSTVSNSRSHQNIDFYETDLLDIVSSINRK